MENLKILREIFKQSKELLNEEFKALEENLDQDKSFDLEINQGNIINLTIYELSQMPYFNDRYNFIRISKNNETGAIKLHTLKSNYLPLLINTINTSTGNIPSQEPIVSDFGHANPDEYRDNTSNYNLLLKEKDIKTLNEFKLLLKNSQTIEDLKSKIHEKDENFFIDYIRLRNQSYPENNFIENILENSIDNILKNKYKLSPEGNSPEYILKKAIPGASIKYLNLSPKEILKDIINDKENCYYKMNNLLPQFFEIKEPKDNKNIKKEIKKINQLIKAGHPYLKSSIYYILMTTNKEDINKRFNLIINELIFTSFKQKELSNIDQNLINLTLENEEIKKYKKNIDKIIYNIKEEFPEFKENIKDLKKFEVTNTPITIDSKLPIVNLPQNWMFSEHWDKNESLKGVFNVTESVINITDEGNNKYIMSIKNNIENVGYLIFFKDKKTMHIAMICPSYEMINNKKFIQTVNTGINEYIKENKINAVLLSEELIPEAPKNIIKQENIDLYFNDCVAYIIGDKQYHIKEDQVINPVKNLLYNMEKHEKIDINKINKEIIKKLKNLEKKYPNNEINLSERINVKKEITETFLNNKKPKGLKND